MTTTPLVPAIDQIADSDHVPLPDEAHLAAAASSPVTTAGRSRRTGTTCATISDGPPTSTSTYCP